jgi:NAD(P)-dependent dehydrogenase (short-subunit alcohol dehydrogenase family)
VVAPPEHHEQRVAIITGASQGIGAGLAKAYRERGYAVIAAARSIGASADPGVVTVEGDIADPDTAQRIVQAAVEHFGRIDTLVNNAGIYIGKPFTDYTLEDFNALIAVNVAGFFHMTTRAIEQMLEQGRGHVVNVSTSLVEQPDSSRPAALQTLTKGGLVAVTRSLAIEYASRGIRVNAVSLGVIKTPAHDESSYAGMGALHPIGRVGGIEDVVPGVLYLESAPFVTGEILHIDGGQSAGH